MQLWDEAEAGAGAQRIWGVFSSLGWLVVPLSLLPPQPPRIMADSNSATPSGRENGRGGEVDFKKKTPFLCWKNPSK